MDSELLNTKIRPRNKTRALSHTMKISTIVHGPPLMSKMEVLDQGKASHTRRPIW